MKEPVLEIEIVKINEEYSSWYINKINKEVFTNPGLYNFIDGESNRYLFYITETETSFSEGFKDGFIHQIFKLNINQIKVPKIIENKDTKYLQKIVDFVNDKFGAEKPWKAKTNDAYFYINSVGRCDHDFECNSQYDNFRYELGNYFKTENEVERIIASKEWKEFWNKVKNKQI
jgi:hypothetical protein